MTIWKDVLDKPLSGVDNANDLLDEQGLMRELKVQPKKLEQQRLSKMAQIGSRF